MSSRGWIGVDLDGTLASYQGWCGLTHIGEPIPAMVERVKHWLQDGLTVKIFTARVYCPQPASVVDAISYIKRADEVQIAAAAIEAWCEKHLGQRLAITCMKDYDMVELWDDRCVQVLTNTGQRADEVPLAKPQAAMSTLCLTNRHSECKAENCSCIHHTQN